MLPTLRDVLSLPAWSGADVEVLTGNPDRTAIRWVHSSEVYEMGGLLAGGELLLTTGLGLHGRSAEQLSAYLDRLADAGCAAVALELGRSFFEVPGSLLLAAQRRGMVLLAVRTVVPFERVVEDFHELLVQRRIGGTSSVLADLVAIVQHGHGLRPLLDAVARLSGCAVDLVDVDDRLIESSRIAVPRGSEEPLRVSVRGSGGVLGSLLVHGVATSARRVMAEQAATAVALELGRALVRGEPPTALGALVADLLAGTAMSHRQVVDRLRTAGWVHRPGGHAVVALVEVGDGDDPVPVLRRRVGELFGAGLVGRVRDHAVVLVPTSGTDLQRVRRTFGALYDSLGPQGDDAIRRVAVAPGTDSLSELGARLAQARQMLEVAGRSGRHRGVVVPADVAVEDLLAAAGGEAATRLVEQHLGPLIAHDTTSASDLVRTLDAWVAANGSKASAAAALGIRRQTLYSRMRRIELVLGVELDVPAHHLTMAVALRAWRLRSGLDPQTAFERGRGGTHAEAVAPGRSDEMRHPPGPPGE